MLGLARAKTRLAHFSLALGNLKEAWQPVTLADASQTFTGGKGCL